MTTYNSDRGCILRGPWQAGVLNSSLPSSLALLGRVEAEFLFAMAAAVVAAVVMAVAMAVVMTVARCCDGGSGGVDDGGDGAGGGVEWWWIGQRTDGAYFVARHTMQASSGKRYVAGRVAWQGRFALARRRRLQKLSVKGRQLHRNLQKKKLLPTLMRVGGTSSFISLGQNTLRFLGIWVIRL